MPRNTNGKGNRLARTLQDLFSKKKNGVPKESSRLLSLPHFGQRLEQERARTDRTGAPFTLLFFGVDGKVPTQVEHYGLEVMIALLINRVRVSDSFGHFRQGLGIILPSTTAAEVDGLRAALLDAYRQRIRAYVADEMTPPQLSCEVYTYPGKHAHLENFKTEHLIESSASK